MTGTAGHADIVDTYYILFVSWSAIVIRRLSNDEASAGRRATLKGAIAKFSDWISSRVLQKAGHLELAALGVYLSSWKH